MNDRQAASIEITGRDGGPSARFLHAAATSGHDFPNISFDSESRGGNGTGIEYRIDAESAGW